MSTDRHTPFHHLQAYDPACGEPPTPEISEALEVSMRDPALRAAHEAEIALDHAMRSRLAKIPVPADLATRIKAAHARAAGPTPAPPERLPRQSWLHFSLLGSIAAALIMLTLAYTFFLNPFEARATPELQAFIEKAETAFDDYGPADLAGLNRFAEFVAYLENSSAPVPSVLPTGLNAETSVACRRVLVDGVPVAILCFRREGEVFHLFTFQRSALPDQQDILRPVVKENGKRCRATWTDRENVYFLMTSAPRRSLETVL